MVAASPRCRGLDQSDYYALTLAWSLENADTELALWGSLAHPTERDVVRLVSEGLSNKHIGTRLFVSPRTVQTDLTHVYTKLGFTSRLQLCQEAARHI